MFIQVCLKLCILSLPKIGCFVWIFCPTKTRNVWTNVQCPIIISSTGVCVCVCVCVCVSVFMYAFILFIIEIINFVQISWDYEFITPPFPLPMVIAVTGCSYTPYGKKLWQ